MLTRWLYAVIENNADTSFTSDLEFMRAGILVPFGLSLLMRYVNPDRVIFLSAVASLIPHDPPTQRRIRHLSARLSGL